MKEYKVIVWGTSIEYDYYRKWLEVELLKGSIQIIGMILNEDNLFRKMDGIDIIGLTDLKWMTYDYIIDLNQGARTKINRIIELLKLPPEKMVPIRLFGQPFFDFARWIQVKESDISIISSHCWGGYVYNTLGLKFGSPLINMFFDNSDFFRLLEDIEGYMQQQPELLREEYETNLQRMYPVVGVGDVTIHFNHYSDFDEAITCWNRRKSRINYRNLFVEMTAKTDKDIERFLQLPYQHKICFTMLPCQEKDVISICNSHFLKKYEDREWQFALATAMKTFEESKQYDLLKLLNHEEEYCRAEVI